LSPGTLRRAAAELAFALAASCGEEYLFGFMLLSSTIFVPSTGEISNSRAPGVPGIHLSE
jgi:hypothetical protein